MNLEEILEDEWCKLFALRLGTRIPKGVFRQFKSFVSFNHNTDSWSLPSTDIEQEVLNLFILFLEEKFS